MSNLEKHAEREMRLAGLYDKDADYGGMIPKNVIEVVTAFAAAGHSGESAAQTLSILERVLRFKTLTPITKDPVEWMEVGEDQSHTPGKTLWQNRRDCSNFSNDGGKTYYNVDDPGRKQINSAPSQN